MNNMIAKIGCLKLMEIKTFFFKKETIVFIITRLFFLLFLFSAGDKLYDLEKFRMQLGQSPVLTSFAGTVVWAIPAVEIIIAFLLVISKTTLKGLYASFCLMVMFTGYIFVIMNYSEYIPCSCNGVLEGATWGQHLAFNIVFVLLALIGILLHNWHKPSMPKLNDIELRRD